MPRDPANSYRYQDLTFNLNYAERYQEALIAHRHELDLNPKSRFGHCVTGILLLYLGNAASALEEMDRDTDPKLRMECASNLAEVYDALGCKLEADATLASLKKAHATDRAYSIACVYSVRGDLNKAFHWLERAYRQHDHGMLSLMVDPELKNVRSDPRYKALLLKMKLRMTRLACICEIAVVVECGKQWGPLAK